MRINMSKWGDIVMVKLILYSDQLIEENRKIDSELSKNYSYTF